MGSTKVAEVLAVLVVAACSAMTGVAHADPDPSPPPSPTPAPAPPPAPKTVIESDGNYLVGTDIVPGIYRSAGPSGDSACYWKRVSGDQIIDNSLSRKPQVVQIEPTDTMFRTHRCQPWQKTECPPDCVNSQPRPPLVLPPGLKDFPARPPQAPAPAPGAR